ncbi:TetR family transcriptional regulator C-terminal domain-containing protein [Shimia ponticola]|uniref:TetR family transcriptional regulator C-terminal domain-containing protein n=1 Tax=Shimia ponticola TaxID=2582893 RepID=UPI0021051D79|nr:TetR family transcriptional regulator C-terminal domain-containing protein [Shimia ponticola]
MTAKDNKPQTRIQRKKHALILDAALDVFSTDGFRGATLDAIAARAEMSKPNLLYYFASKEAIHTALLSRLLANWLDPLITLNPSGDPLQEILSYVQRKLEMARDYPRESRLFAGEILRGAPHMGDALRSDLRRLVDEKATVIQGWIDQGRLAPHDPHHLIMSIWAQTQHYADFDIQVRAVLGDADWAGAEAHLKQLFTRMLTPT